MSYNHKETVKNLTPEQRKENIDWIIKTHRQAIRGRPVTCRGCEIDFELHLLYRCYFCGSYFCGACSENHFGSRK